MTTTTTTTTTMSPKFFPMRSSIFWYRDRFEWTNSKFDFALNGNQNSDSNRKKLFFLRKKMIRHRKSFGSAFRMTTVSVTIRFWETATTVSDLPSLISSWPKTIWIFYSSSWQFLSPKWNCSGCVLVVSNISLLLHATSKHFQENLPF